MGWSGSVRGAKGDAERLGIGGFLGRISLVMWSAPSGDRGADLRGRRSWKETSSATRAARTPAFTREAEVGGRVGEAAEVQLDERIAAVPEESFDEGEVGGQAMVGLGEKLRLQLALGPLCGGSE